jgi:hypothetical protein
MKKMTAMMTNSLKSGVNPRRQILPPQRLLLPTRYISSSNIVALLKNP